MNDRIEIVMATYNGSKYLQEQIQSFFSQTYENWHLTVRDDGSTDNTLSILEGFAAKHPDRITIYRDSSGNLGPTLNFSLLLQNSRSDYTMLSDQDDVWLPDKIKLTLAKMKESEALFPDLPVLVFTDLAVVNSLLEPLFDSLWQMMRLDPSIAESPVKLAALNVVTGCTAMINCCARNIALPIPNRYLLHDHWLAVEIARLGRVIPLDRKTVLYRQHGANELGALKVDSHYLFRKTTSIPRQIEKYYHAYKAFGKNLNIFNILINKITLNLSRGFIFTKRRD